MSLRITIALIISNNGYHFTRHLSFGWHCAMSFMLIPINNPMWEVLTDEENGA